MITYANHAVALAIVGWFLVTHDSNSRQGLQDVTHKITALSLQICNSTWDFLRYIEYLLYLYDLAILLPLLPDLAVTHCMTFRHARIPC